MKIKHICLIFQNKVAGIWKNVTISNNSGLWNAVFYQMWVIRNWSKSRWQCLAQSTAEKEALIRTLAYRTYFEGLLVLLILCHMTTFIWIFGIFCLICFGPPFNGPEYQEIYKKNFKISQNLSKNLRCVFSKIELASLISSDELKLFLIKYSCFHKITILL